MYFYCKSLCYIWWCIAVQWLFMCLLTVFIGCGKDTHSAWIHLTQSRLMCRIVEKYFYFMLMVSFFIIQKMFDGSGIALALPSTNTINNVSLVQSKTDLLVGILSGVL